MEQVALEIPQSVQKYFWGDNLKELNWNANQKYIVQTLLDKGDKAALHWLFSITPRETIKSMLPNLRLSKKSANFWNIYLS